jgi:hypothetical protein
VEGDIPSAAEAAFVAWIAAGLKSRPFKTALSKLKWFFWNQREFAEVKELFSYQSGSVAIK